MSKSSINSEKTRSIKNVDVDDDLEEVTPVLTSGGRGEFVYLGGKKYLRSELIYAFGGDLNPGVVQAPHLKLGNPTPMGLFAFATTTLILSFINAGARNVKTPAIVLGCAMFYGGVVQIIAGIWELVLENSFGATVFTAYGGFWLSFSVISMNGFNIASAYKTGKELDNALGLYFVAWTIVTLFFTLMTLRSTVAMFFMLMSLTITFILLAGSKFTSASASLGVSENLGIAAGVFGCLTAMAAYYNGLAGILTKENSWIKVHPVFMPGAIRPEDLDKAKAKEV